MSPTHRNGRDLEIARDGWGLGAAARALEWRVGLKWRVPKTKGTNDKVSRCNARCTGNDI